MECAAEILPVCSRAGRSLCQQLDDGQVRSGQPSGPAQIARERRQAACVLAADHGCLLQGGKGTAQRSLCNECRLQEGLWVADRFFEQRLSVVPGRRSRLRQLHGASLTELTLSTDVRPTKTSERELRGFLFYCGKPTSVAIASADRNPAAADRSAESRF